MLENFAAAIRHGEPLIAPAPEGLRSLTLGNAMLMSSFLGHPVDLPFDADLYESMLQERIRTSGFQKEVRLAPDEDINKSFGYH
jgi:hypothetical protein